MHVPFKRLKHQTIVIMGATSGIGLVLARKASKAGAAVFLIARDRAQLEKLCRELTTAGGRAAFAVADVGDEAAVRAAAAAAVTCFGGFDTWVNTAGVALYAPLLETRTDDHQRLFQTNYWGVVYGCKAAAEQLRRRGGAIITVGSVVGEFGTPILGAYAASKHAVKGYIDSLRIELLSLRLPISVSLIKPSGIGTPMAEHAPNNYPAAGRIPPPAYDPALVADVILYAAQHPCRQMIVGGVGALQALGYVLFPGLSDVIASKIGRFMTDKSRPAPTASNLYAPHANGMERSRFEPMLRFSLYNAVTLNPWRAAIAAIGVAAWATVQVRRRL